MKKAGRDCGKHAGEAEAARAWADFVCDRLPGFLRGARRLLHLSKYELAKRTGLERQTIAQIESGDCVPTPHSLVRIGLVVAGAVMKAAEEPALATPGAEAKSVSHD